MSLSDIGKTKASRVNSMVTRMGQTYLNLKLVTASIAREVYRTPDDAQAYVSAMNAIGVGADIFEASAIIEPVLAALAPIFGDANPLGSIKPDGYEIAIDSAGMVTLTYTAPASSSSDSSASSGSSTSSTATVVADSSSSSSSPDPTPLHLGSASSN